ncbi:MAG: DNA-processing protein DprA [Marinifilaceae bacterium]
MDDALRYKIAISMFKGIGPVLVKKLIEHSGSIEAFFEDKNLDVSIIPNFGKERTSRIDRELALINADKEIEFCLKNGIRIITDDDDDFPLRLKYIPDAPLLIYCKGDISFNNEKVVSIVGTRRASLYGKNACDDIVRGFKERGHDPVIVSGLAYGIDVAAHKAALDNGLRTVGVVAHGLNTLYPAAHKNIARQMVESGGAVLSDFSTLRTAEAKNFLKRNRIVAGLADALIVIESAEKGGSMITATLANSYDRDVFALPGKTSDKYSRGCNLLIKQSRASLIECAEDIEYLMGWEINEPFTPEIKLPLQELSSEESIVYSFVEKNQRVLINDIAFSTKIPLGKLSAILLSLELKNMLFSLPGNMYTIGG